jgi:signal transduction histidine kinase
MSALWSVRAQVALVVALFLGSVLVLLDNAFSVLGLPRRQLQTREMLQGASRALVDAARQVRRPDPETEDQGAKLHAVAEQVLAAFPGAEGGFYLAGPPDRFVGYAFPTGPLGPDPLPLRSDPPPNEMPYIRAQARQSADLPEGESQTQALDVVNSRVVVVTAPVDQTRPARLVAWVMYRLTRLEDLQAEVRRFWLSVGLALAGMALSLGLAVNLTHRLNRQRREQERLRDELRRAEHLAGLGRLLAGVAHEVRTPLAGIRSTVQLWERLPETAQSPDSRAAVVRAVDRLNDLVSRLLYFARSGNEDRRPLSVNQLLTETLTLLEAQAAGQSVTIERDLDPKAPQVLGSANALRQVFLNLATNALQAMPDGGTLRCRTRGQQDRVEVRFADTGPGVAPEDRRHLFEPFFTTRPEGTGLGLALCREIVAQHGGQIELEAQAEGGAAFRLHLPAC